MYPSTIEFLRHIQSECEYLNKEYNSNSYEEFTNNERLTRAVCRSLEIISEAVNKIHPDIKIQYNDIPWREISDLRNRIIHHYFGIDFEIIWDVIENEISILKE
ncbi:MAG: DUF86 domain-containing protein [Flavobacteriales bacterium]|jgi:uncharacterized protein with HEPN domain|nr:DUF86 domain-containing protein [Flavobacteriales bacterium]